MNIISGLYNEGQIRVGIVATRFNEVVVSKLVDGAAGGRSFPSRSGYGYCRSGMGAGSV